jgi:hypothetical protein
MRLAALRFAQMRKAELPVLLTAASLFRLAALRFAQIRSPGNSVYAAVKAGVNLVLIGGCADCKITISRFPAE